MFVLGLPLFTALRETKFSDVLFSCACYLNYYYLGVAAKYWNAVSS